MKALADYSVRNSSFFPNPRRLIGQTVAGIERDLIIETLRACDGNRTRAAKTLAIAVRTLRNKINEYEAKGVDIPAPESELIRNR